nr:hypothetical protein [Planctomycetota bacterium]
MTFTCSDQHIADFHHHGYTVFRGIVPTSLVADLRRAFEPGYALARSAQGVDTQRLQPVKAWAIDQAPFRDFIGLPALRDAIQRVLSPGHAMTDVLLGVLIQPAQRAWHMAWHRDWIRPDMPEDCAAEVTARLADVRLFNQMN